MELFNQSQLKKLYVPSKTSHKGQNGKLAIIGGSHLFHGASLWALKVASRIVDIVFYASIPENNELTKELKSKIYDFIAVPRDKVDDYLAESDVILIGPGLPRESGREKDEEVTRDLTKRFFQKFPDKTWVIDAGSLTEMNPQWLKNLRGNVILTPHHKEFEKLFDGRGIADVAKEYNVVILLKGPTDVVCSPAPPVAGPAGLCVEVKGGNEGMTKGGTGDVLAGLVAALACKNDPFLAACSASFINKKAGEALFTKVGPYFNASDLADCIPGVLKEFLA